MLQTRLHQSIHHPSSIIHYPSSIIHYPLSIEAAENNNPIGCKLNFYSKSVLFIPALQPR